MKLCTMYVISSSFATVLFATVLKLSCTSETIFIKINNSSDHQCPAEPCLTLQNFLSYRHRVESNTTLKFLPGNHVILFATRTNISVMDVVNVTLTGVSDQQSSVIHCMSEFSVIAINVQNFTISKLFFSGCGAPIPEGTVPLQDSSITFKSATLFLLLVSNVSILDIHVHDSRGAGILAVNSFDFKLNRTSFVGNTQNCVIVFRDESNPPVKLLVSSYIANSEFAYGRTESLRLGVHFAGGLSLIFKQRSYTVYMNIVNVALYKNTGILWGNFLMTVGEWSCRYTTVRAEKVRSSNCSALCALSGFAVREIAPDISVSPHQVNHSLHFEYTLHILDSYFDSMGNIAVDVSAYQRSNNLRVKFTDIFVKGSHMRISSGMRISNMFLLILKGLKVISCKGSAIQVINSEITMCDVHVQ